MPLGLGYLRFIEIFYLLLRKCSVKKPNVVHVANEILSLTIRTVTYKKTTFVRLQILRIPPSADLSTIMTDIALFKIGCIYIREGMRHAVLVENEIHHEIWRLGLFVKVQVENPDYVRIA